jgi:hypothetical protein
MSTGTQIETADQELSELEADISQQRRCPGRDLESLEALYEMRLIELAESEIADSAERLGLVFQRFIRDHGEGNYGAFRLASSMMRNVLGQLQCLSTVLAGPLDAVHDPFPDALCEQIIDNDQPF